MFCSKCGKEIPDDSIFCLSCGNEILQNTTKEIVVQDKTTIITDNQNQPQKFSKRNVDLSHKSMKKMGINETVYQGRIDSVEDKELNEKLFTLYAKLIPPVKEMEKQFMLINEAERDLDRKTYIYILSYCKILYVIFIFVNVFLAYIIDSYWTFFVLLTNLLSHIYSPETAEMLATGFIVFINPLLEVLLIQLFLFLLQPLIDANRHSRDRKVIARAKDSIQKIDVVIAPYIAFVPNDYRHSDALEYFCKAYNNTQIDNLKEAVNNYVQYARHQEMLDAIRLSTSTIVAHLQNIEYQNAATLQKLDSMEQNITASIWASSFAFSW